jgi:hypothetical protein
MLTYQNTGNRANQAGYSSEHFTVPTMQKSHVRGFKP